MADQQYHNRPDTIFYNITPDILIDMFNGGVTDRDEILECFQCSHQTMTRWLRYHGTSFSQIKAEWQYSRPSYTPTYSNIVSTTVYRNGNTNRQVIHRPRYK